MEEHKCILSCKICLKEHREILNRIDRCLETIDCGIDNIEYIERILRGESH